MAKLHLTREIEDVTLPAGATVEVDGPVTDEMQAWLDEGDAELVIEGVNENPRPYGAGGGGGGGPQGR